MKFVNSLIVAGLVLSSFTAKAAIAKAPTKSKCSVQFGGQTADLDLVMTNWGDETFEGTYFFTESKDPNFRIIPATADMSIRLTRLGVTKATLVDAITTISIQVLKIGKDKTHITLRIGTAAHDQFRNPLYFNDPLAWFPVDIQVDQKEPITQKISVIREDGSKGSAKIQVRCISNAVK